MSLLEIIGLFYCLRLFCKFLDAICDLQENKDQYGVVTGPDKRARQGYRCNLKCTSAYYDQMGTTLTFEPEDRPIEILDPKFGANLWNQNERS